MLDFLLNNMGRIKSELNQINFNFENLDQEALAKKSKFNNQVREFKSTVAHIRNIWRLYKVEPNSKIETSEKLKKRCVGLGKHARDNGYTDIRAELLELYRKL